MMRKVIFFLLLACPLLLKGIYLENLPTEVPQPDGTILSLFTTGDEYYQRVHDKAGYTVLRNGVDGKVYYAMKAGDKLVPSSYLVGRDNPATKGLSPNLTETEESYRDKVSFMKSHETRGVKSPQTGTVNNICVMIRFADQSEFTTPLNAYDEKFNSLADSVFSVRHYFKSVSYQQLNLVTSIFPVSNTEAVLSYQDSHNRNYFLPYDAAFNPSGYGNDDERALREQNLIADAVSAIEPSIPADFILDADYDGTVDNICFVIRGPHAAWSDLLWAHKWSMWYTEASIHGVEVSTYTFQPENQNDAYVMCHELFHAVGAPDLYHYNFNGVCPAGIWDIMESGKGHMGAYMKYRYGGWISDIPIISTSGTYTLSPVSSSTNNCYRINIPNYSNMALVLEYRKKGADCFEANLPNSGLLIYRIDTNQDGNAYGPPDEVYIFRPDGTSSVNGDLSEATFSSDYWRTDFNPHTNPATAISSFETANIAISNVSECGDVITFDCVLQTPEIAPIVSITNPTEGNFLHYGTNEISCEVTEGSNAIETVRCYVDDTLIATDISSPYSFSWVTNNTMLGHHTVRIEALASDGLLTTKQVKVNIIDPAQINLFQWISDVPEWIYYGRGSIPIQVAIDLDLGTKLYTVTQIGLGLQLDPYAESNPQGTIHAKIMNMDTGTIGSMIIDDLGELPVLMDQYNNIPVNSSVELSGRVVLVVELEPYVNIQFDSNGLSGHSWLAETGRPWTDAFARGVIGAANMALYLRSNDVANEDEVLTDGNQIQNYPNPFSASTTISFINNGKVASNPTVEIYNIKGQKVKTIYYTPIKQGMQTVAWDGKNENGESVADGVYLIKNKNSYQQKVHKLLLKK